VKQFVAILDIQNLKVVLETYGSGNAPTEDWFISLLIKAIKKACILSLTLRNVAGSVNGAI
jgi:L-asparaginase